MNNLKWYEDDNFWSSDILTNSKARIKGSAEMTKALVNFLQPMPGASILDLCCGYGIYSVELARLGFNVTGVDITAPWLDQGKKRAGENNVTIDFIKEDMREFCRPASFDFIINMFTSFGYFENKEDDLTVLRKSFTSLKEKGKLLINLYPKELVARNFTTMKVYNLEEYIVVAEAKILQNWTWIENKLKVIKDHQVKELRYAHRLYSAEELKNLFVEVGFKNVSVYGDFNMSPYDHNSEELMIVGEKL